MDLTFINLIPTITELSDECDLPTKNEYMRHKTKEQLENYLIRDVIGIVQAYTDWKDFSGQALFSVPFEKFKDRNDIVFLSRTDKQDYTINLSTPQTIKIPGYFELCVNLVQTGFEIIDNPNVRYLVGYLPESKSKLEPEWIFPSHEELNGTLDFRSPSFSGVGTIDMHLIRIGQTVHLEVLPFMVESTQRTNRVLMTTFGTKTKIPERFRPRYTISIPILVTHGGEVGVISFDNVVQRCGLVQIHRDGNVIILELQKFVNEFYKCGFQAFNVVWYVDK